MRKIRVRTAGIFIRDGHILLVKHCKGSREYYLLPGGGQEAGESAESALVREWHEELNVKITVGDFLFLGESVPASYIRKSQVLQLVFRVNSLEGEIKVKRDGALIGYDWVPVEKLGEVDFFPACLEQIRAVVRGEEPVRYRQYVWLK